MCFHNVVLCTVFIVTAEIVQNLIGSVSQIAPF